jgi:hypothetical protein
MNGEGRDLTAEEGRVVGPHRSTGNPDWTKVYRRKRHIVSRAIIGETLLVPIRGHLADLQKIFSLNSVGDYIWDALDGENSLLHILEGVTTEFDTTKETAGVDLIAFIDELLESELIDEVRR